MNEKTINLTEYSHGAGCGCKISPKALDVILSGPGKAFNDPNLLVSNLERDDAGAYDLGDGTVILSTVDFFMPIVDDPYDFGRIASINAISDIYAMGGKPFMAVAVLGWPVDKIPEQFAMQVVEGAKAVCKEVGIVVAGGHSIDNPEPVFGLSVNGIVKRENLKRNSTATDACTLFLTKPLGVGILCTAKKRKIVEDSDYKAAIDSMLSLNKFGEFISSFSEVKAITDVTGFGLLGHLGEMVDASNISAEIYFNKVPQLPNLEKYISLGAIPGGSTRNWNSYKDGIEGIESDLMRAVLCDPQTSGGLLIAVDANFKDEFLKVSKQENLLVSEIGRTVARNSTRIAVIS
jgi:selenide,water dikinase